MKDFRGRLSVEHDPRAMIESPLCFGDLTFRDGVKVDAVREVFPDQTVDLLDRTTLPRDVWIAEVDRHLCGEGEGGMLGHFAAVVVGGVRPVYSDFPTSVILARILRPIGLRAVCSPGMEWD